MPLIRGTIKPTSELWSHVIILSISHLHHLRYGSSGWHAVKFQSMWYVISEQLGAQCNQALLLFYAYTGCDLPSSMLSIVKGMKCVECFSCYKHFCRPDLRPNQTYHQFPEYGMSGTPDCWCRPKNCGYTSVSEARKWLSTQAHSLWTLHQQHSMLCSSIQNVHWWSMISQRC